MLYPQRAVSSKATTEPVNRWIARMHRVDGSAEELQPEDGDWYIAIDDLAYGRVVFDAAPWPLVDERGRLVFGKRRAARTADLVAAQAAIDAARADIGQQIRPLRIGDAFLVRDGELPRDVRRWHILADVTREAREAAKLALFAAVAPRLQPEEERMLPEPPEPGESGGEPGGGAAGQAFPAV